LLSPSCDDEKGGGRGLKLGAGETRAPAA